jgi:ribosomal protein S2
MSSTAQQIVDAQLHIGTLKSDAHPKTNKYWAEVKNGLVVINPDTIAQQLETAKSLVQKTKAEGKEILVICEKKMYADELEALAEKS